MSDFVTLGELLIDFTPSGQMDGRNLFMQNAGGAVANAAAAVAGFGISTAFMGMVGNDQFGHFLSDTLKAKNINVEGLLLSQEYNTTLAFVHLFENGERDFSFYRKPGADIMYTSAQLNKDIIDQCKVFHFGAVSLTDEPMRGTLFEALDYAKSIGKIISYDPNYRAPLWTSDDDARKQMLRGLEYADILKISDNEVTFLFGDISYEEAAKMLASRKIAQVYITLGSKGAIYANASGAGMAEGFAADAIDATGAGDCFTGSVIYKFIESGKTLSGFSLENMQAAALFANAAASICVEGRGGIPSMPSRAQVNERLGTS